MPEPNFDENYSLRQKNVFKPFPYNNKKFSESFFPYFTKLYNALPTSLQCQVYIEDFKNELSSKLKPTKIKLFHKGNKIANKYHARLRLNRSTLNAHTYSIGLAPSPNCQCNNIETVETLFT